MKRIAFFILSLLPMVSFAQKKDLALTPPMGWNTWNYFHCDINEEVIREMADAMVSTGMADAGYEYIVIDDCWQIDRDKNGRIVVDSTRFPSGIQALADYVHSKGLKFGIYSDAGFKTCQGRPGSFGYEEIDAATYAAWGVDYLKYDWCAHRLKRAENTYPRMADALYQQERPIVYSICNWGWGNPWEWAPEISHLWRTTWDIEPEFNERGHFVYRNVLQILDKNEALAQYAGPGAWNDPDMLEVGNNKEWTYEQNRAHFTLWAMMAAPLMAGNDLRNMNDTILSILTHKGVIAIDQDPLGVQGFRIGQEGPVEIWLKPLQGGGKAICFFNRSEESVDITLNLVKRLNLSQRYSIHNVWRNENDGDTWQKKLRIITLKPWDVALYRLAPMGE